MLGRAIHSFWRHGDLFSGAAITFYALFSLLPLTLLLLVGLQFIFSAERVTRNLGRLFGLTDDLILRTVRAAYAQQGSFGWLETITPSSLQPPAWQVITRVLDWYLGAVADYATLYHSLGAIMALVAWVYGLTCSFLLGAEFIAQHTPGPRRSRTFRRAI